MRKMVLIILFFLALALIISACGSNSTGTLPILAPKEVVKDLNAEQCSICHAKYYEEWNKGKHKVALVTLNGQQYKGDSCLGCMSTEGALAENKSKVTMNNVKYGVTCLACHLPHGSREGIYLRLPKEQLCISCHTAGEIKPGQGVHHSQKEMFLGIGGIGVENMPSKKSKVGIVCFDCHMPLLAKQSLAAVPENKFDGLQARYKDLLTLDSKDNVYKSKNLKARSSHSFKVILEGPDSSCLKCHPDYPEGAFSASLMIVQGDIIGQLFALDPQVTALDKTFKTMQEQKKDPGQALKMFNEAKVNIEIVKSDKSFGFHNYPYAKALLKAANEKITQTQGLLAGKGAK